MLNQREIHTRKGNAISIQSALAISNTDSLKGETLSTCLSIQNYMGKTHPYI